MRESMNKNDSYITNEERLTYQIVLPGSLDIKWLDWKGEMTAEIGDDGQHRSITTLTINVDQADLHGLLMKIYSLGLPLISVLWIDFPGSCPGRKELPSGSNQSTI